MNNDSYYIGCTIRPVWDDNL